jgi:hypothetical protein
LVLRRLSQITEKEYFWFAGGKTGTRCLIIESPGPCIAHGPVCLKNIHQQQGYVLQRWRKATAGQMAYF